MDEGLRGNFTPFNYLSAFHEKACLGSGAIRFSLGRGHVYPTLVFCGGLGVLRWRLEVLILRRL